MDINAAFPSKYVKSSDLQGREVKINISRVAMEKVGDGMKAVLYFVGKEKGMVLNKTNSNVILKAYGTETDGWINKPIILFAQMVEYQGDLVNGIRLRADAAPVTTGLMAQSPDGANPFTGQVDVAAQTPAPQTPVETGPFAGVRMPVETTSAPDLNDDIPF